MLQFLHSAATLYSAPGIVQLHGSFAFKGHHCIVLEELGGDLRVLAATSAHIPGREAVGQLRSIAFQLMVGSHADLAGESHKCFARDQRIISYQSS